jgi:hypothetical protein
MTVAMSVTKESIEAFAFEAFDMVKAEQTTCSGTLGMLVPFFSFSF